VGIGSAPRAEPLDAIAELLSEYFSTSVALWNGDTGELLRPATDGPTGDELVVTPWVQKVAAGSRPQFIVEGGNFRMLAIPVVGEVSNLVATAMFVTGSVSVDEVVDATTWCDLSADQIQDWSRNQTIWLPELLLKMAAAIQGQLSAEARARRAEREIDVVSENLATTYEEISLLYTITQNLRISSTDEDLGRLAIERLEECLAAESFAVQFLPVTTDEDATGKSRTKPLFLCSESCPVNEQEFTRLIATLKISPSGGPFVANRRVTESANWQFRAVRQFIVVPLVEGENIFGWLAAFNHRRDELFGTVESNLLASLGTLLGIHCGNRDLYRQQSELLQNIVRALVSAIDAKDPYTSGHSDRVARFAVRLALEMKCNPKLINTIYMAGLLHDVGKIGIDDNVLRKAGRLTDIEFEHIKRHPELGHKILADLKQLADVLPAVLHHHERWDGKGYPYGLTADEIPKIARIMAVADSYDAMTSDRPYRSGMPVEKVYQIFRDESGKYWDPEVIEAFFNAKEDIRAISERERAQIDSLQQHLV
jgi:HD-GYP domain-containing protein (c-di-GMP phosphodiesterase class II)